MSVVIRVDPEVADKIEERQRKLELEHGGRITADQALRDLLHDAGVIIAAKRRPADSDEDIAIVIPEEYRRRPGLARVWRRGYKAAAAGEPRAYFSLTSYGRSYGAIGFISRRYNAVFLEGYDAAKAVQG